MRHKGLSPVIATRYLYQKNLSVACPIFGRFPAHMQMMQQRSHFGLQLAAKSSYGVSISENLEGEEYVVQMHLKTLIHSDVLCLFRSKVTSTKRSRWNEAFVQTKADLNNHMPGHPALACVAGYSSFYCRLNGTKLCFSWNCQVSNNTQGESHRVKNQDTRSK